MKATVRGRRPGRELALPSDKYQCRRCGIVHTHSRSKSEKPPTHCADCKWAMRHGG